jgi:hypothetical protein
MTPSSLWGRLKGARIVQVLLVYLGALWGILQIADVLSEALSLPEWVRPVALLLLLIGLVIILATAWVQSLPSTTAAEQAGEIPTDWEIAPSDVVASVRSGKLPHLTWGRAVLGGVVALSLLFGGAGVYVLFVAWHFLSGRKSGATADDYGLTWGGRVSWPKVGKSLLFAWMIALSAYVSLAVSPSVFTVDYRFWVFAVKPMSLLHARMSLSYLIPFVLFFGVYGVVLFGQLRRDLNRRREALLVVALSTLGFVGLIAFQYVPLFMGGTLAIPSESLWSIIAFQFLPLMTIVGLVTAYFQRMTGHVYVGAFLSGMLVTWIVIASQATHFGF